MQHDKTQHSKMMNDCIEACLACAKTCTETVSHCLSMGGEHAKPAHIALLLSCAEICQTSANAMLRGAQGSAAICGACAEICRRCAESCESLGKDPGMKRCAEACRACEKTCTAMAATM